MLYDCTFDVTQNSHHNWHKATLQCWLSRGYLGACAQPDVGTIPPDRAARSRPPRRLLLRVGIRRLGRRAPPRPRMRAAPMCGPRRGRRGLGARPVAVRKSPGGMLQAGRGARLWGGFARGSEAPNRPGLAAGRRHSCGNFMPVTAAACIVTCMAAITPLATHRFLDLSRTRMLPCLRSALPRFVVYSRLNACVQGISLGLHITRPW